MQFSHIVSLLFAAATRSGTKDDHLAGHSCFRTYIRYAPSERERERGDKTKRIMVNFFFLSFLRRAGKIQDKSDYHGNNTYRR
jgi:hypothetical protein